MTNTVDRDNTFCTNCVGLYYAVIIIRDAFVVYYPVVTFEGSGISGVQERRQATWRVFISEVSKVIYIRCS